MKRTIATCANCGKDILKLPEGWRHHKDGFGRNCHEAPTATPRQGTERRVDQGVVFAK